VISYPWPSAVRMPAVDERFALLAFPDVEVTLADLLG
jgi:hypothetical protein